VGRVPAADSHAWELTAGDVTAFVVASCREGHAPATTAAQMSALRSLLHFLHLEELVDRPLVGAVPPVSLRQPVGLPKALGPGQAEALVASCDPATRAGPRDRALLTVVYRLALRASEAASLRLDGLDWRHGELVVRGKGNRVERLPLPADVGEALTAYLTGARPEDTGYQEVFPRVRAPHAPLTGGGVSAVVAGAARRAGLGGRTRAHRLRHSAATGMLRGGASLAEVSQACAISTR